MNQLLQKVESDEAAKVPPLPNDSPIQHEKGKQKGIVEQNTLWITVKQNKEAQNSGRETWDISMLFL